VIAGTDRGRKLVSPEGMHVRPTKDIVREAMFSALDARGVLVDATVLDLYSGSGALSFEALSRGAARAVLVERDRAALRAIGANVEQLDREGRTRVVPSDVGRFLAGNPPPEAPFDLVFADPPYDTADADVTELLERLGAPGWCVPGAIVSVERPARHPVVTPPGCSCSWERVFGDTLLAFCSR